MQLEKHFDELAPTWDELVTEETRDRMGAIVSQLAIRPEYRVLDVGSGTGVLLSFLIDNVGDEGRIIALDISGQMLRKGRSKRLTSMVDSIQADATAVPLTDRSVDMAICNSVFPHFSDKVRALEEMARVLKNNGSLVICHTMSREMINELHKSIGGIVGDHILPDKPQLQAQMEQAGLRINHFEDRAERYLVIAEKRRRSARGVRT